MKLEPPLYDAPYQSLKKNKFVFNITTCIFSYMMKSNIVDISMLGNYNTLHYIKLSNIILHDTILYYYIIVCHSTMLIVGYLVFMCCCITLISAACEVRYQRTAILKTTPMEKRPDIRRSIECATECEAASHCQGFVHKEPFDCQFIDTAETEFLAEAVGINSTEAYVIYLDTSVARGKSVHLFK